MALLAKIACVSTGLSILLHMNKKDDFEKVKTGDPVNTSGTVARDTDFNQMSTRAPLLNQPTYNRSTLTLTPISKTTMHFSKATTIAFAALLSTALAAPSGSCADKATSCRSSGGASCDQDAKACCDQIQVVSPKSDGDHYQCYQDSGIGSMLSSKRDVGVDCAAAAEKCRSEGTAANCDDRAQSCCDQITVVSPKSDEDHYQCYQDAGIAGRLAESKRDVGDDCAAEAKECRGEGAAAADCDGRAKTCCDQIQVVSPKSDGDHYQCYQNSGIGSMLS
ncbi:hypothetical protein SLS54_002430 [Diplodia seriata]